MKSVDIGFGTVAFEPDADTDRTALIDIASLRGQGVSDKVISMYRNYRDRIERAEFTVDPDQAAR